MALSREIYAVEEQYTEADEQYTELSRKLRHVTQERLNTEEELLASNVRLKQLLGELQAARDAAHAQSSAVVQDNKMTMGELTRKVESTLMTVLDERFRDEAFTSAITEQSVLSTDKVRVEFEGDEVFWSLQDNYSFEMLLGDASRYWDVAPQDAILVDERGAIWPNDAYVGLELQRSPNSRITLKIKPVATTVRRQPIAQPQIPLKDVRHSHPVQKLFPAGGGGNRHVWTRGRRVRGRVRRGFRYGLACHRHCGRG